MLGPSYPECAWTQGGNAMPIGVEDSTRLIELVATNRRLQAQASRLVTHAEALLRRLPRRLKGGSDDLNEGPSRSVIAGRITALHDDYVVVGDLRIHTRDRMTKGLTIGVSVTVTVTRLDGAEIAERVEVIKDSFKP
jgi:hypothetical protein